MEREGKTEDKVKFKKEKEDEERKVRKRNPIKE